MKLLFVDINGTIGEPSIDGSPFTPEEDPTAIRLIPGAADALSRYHHAGWRIIGISNQGGIEAGKRTLGSVIREMQHTLYLANPLAEILFCPDFAGRECWRVIRGYSGQQISNEGGSRWAAFRKPNPGMIAIANPKPTDKEYLMVGDRPEDQQVAAAAGIPFQWAEEWRNAAS